MTIFNYVASQQIPNSATSGRATLVDTNQPSPSALPLRHQIVIFSVQIRFDEIHTGAAALPAAPGRPLARLTGDIDSTLGQGHGIRKWTKIVASTYFILLVENTKPYCEGPLSQFPAGGGLYLIRNMDFSPGVGSLSPAIFNGAAYQINNGEPGMHAARRLAMPVHIGALEQFAGVIKFPRGAINQGTLRSPQWNGGQFGKYGITVGLFGPRQRPIG